MVFISKEIVLIVSGFWPSVSKSNTLSTEPIVPNVGLSQYTADAGLEGSEETVSIDCDSVDEATVIVEVEVVASKNRLWSLLITGRRRCYTFCFNNTCSSS